jgi:maleate isomerase
MSATYGDQQVLAVGVCSPLSFNTAGKNMESQAVNTHRIDIDYGKRLKVGMLIPSANFIVEAQVRAMLPKGVNVLFTRLPLRGSSTQELLSMAENVEGAAMLLADAGVDLIAFNCTAVSTFSRELEGEICQRIVNATGLRAITTGQALVAALRALHAARVMLLTPYKADINVREVAFLEAEGMSVLAEAGLSLNTPAEMAGVAPSVWKELGQRHGSREVEACIISCTAVRSAEVIADLEQALGCPVITSNQALVWRVLRMSGIEDAVPGFGRLLETH